MTTPEMADSNQQDESAVTAVRGGDAERYRELVERHERRVFAVAWSRLGDAALAEEVTQEAFIRAYRRLWLLGDGAKFSGWVSTIARRVAINFGLRHRRELNKCERWALENYAEAAPENSANENDSPHSPETLRQTLAELPAAHRECLVLFYLEGKSGAEAATALGISESALRVRLHRARAALRERLDGKLEGSLEKLRPSKALLPAIMASVLASSSAKAATGGTVAIGVGTKIVSVLSKTALFSWFFPFIMLIGNIPSLIAVSFIMRKERENFRDTQGFRPELHRRFFTSFIWGFPLLLVGFAILNQSVLAAWGIKTHQVILTSFTLVIALISARSLTIGRNAYQVSMFAYCLIIALGLAALAFGWLPASLAQLPLLTATVVLLVFFKQRPVRMDYNLFLRAAHGLLKPSVAAPAAFSRGHYGRAELLAFARFLGSRYLVSNFRWESGGLALRLPPVKNQFLANMVTLFLPPISRNCSHIFLGWNGTFRAHCGPVDAAELSALTTSQTVHLSALESLVEKCLLQAWAECRRQNFSAAERALGDSPESEIFLVSPARSKSTRWWRIMLGTSVTLMALGMFVPLFLPKHDSNHFKLVPLTEAQVRESLEIKAGFKSQEEAFRYDDNSAPAFNEVLPPTNLMSGEVFKKLQRLTLWDTNFFDLNEAARVDRILGTPDLQRAIAGGWITAEDLGLSSETICRTIINSSARQKNRWFNLEPGAVAVGEPGKYRPAGYTILPTDELARKVACLDKLGCLDVFDKQPIIDLLIQHQIVGGHIPSGRRPLADTSILNGLFFTMCNDPIHDTYNTLLILEKLGGLSRVDREACIKGVLRFHQGRGRFSAPDSEHDLAVFGEARDSIAAFESLRILGGLDRIKDLNKWEFRPFFSNQKAAANGHRVATWDEMEAWVCQQRLEKILHERKENSAAPFRSLLEP